MQTGDFVSIEFIGRVKDTGEIFDLTSEEIAKKEGIYNSKTKYGPVTVVVGAGLVLKGLDKILSEMQVGEKRVVEIEPQDAFGERKGELMKLIPLHVFKERDVDPNPGGYVTINGVNGRVVSVDGGRIRVDFNHPLAGKKLQYEIEIKGEVKDTVERIKSVVNYFTAIASDEIKVEVKEKDVEIVLDNKYDVRGEAKQRMADVILKWAGMDKVKFSNLYSR